jgi:hypothetical protein
MRKVRVNMKLSETISDVLDAIIAAPEAIRELREYAKEANDRVKAAERWPLIVQQDKRIIELELELENRKLQEANLGLALERDEHAGELSHWYRWCFGALERRKRLPNIPLDHGVLRNALITYINALESDLSEAKSSPAIEPPDPGEGFELISESDALRDCSSHVLLYNFKEGSWLSEWSPTCSVSITDYRRYAFRRPIAKAEPQWVACTAEEAAANPLEREWLSGGINWTECESYLDEGKLGKIYPYRTTATLPELVTVSVEIWRNVVDKNPNVTRGAMSRCILRGDIPVGTVLG